MISGMTVMPVIPVMPVMMESSLVTLTASLLPSHASDAVIPVMPVMDRVFSHPPHHSITVITFIARL